MVDEGGKLQWFLIFLTFTGYFSPLTFGVNGDYAWLRLAVLVGGFSAIYWFLPRLIILVWDKIRKPDDNAEETGQNPPL
jgi:hypothetical protein